MNETKIYPDRPAATSYVRNCHVVQRDGDPVMFSENGESGCTVKLDGYLIVPREAVPDMAGFLLSLIREPELQTGKEALRQLFGDLQFIDPIDNFALDFDVQPADGGDK